MAFDLIFGRIPRSCARGDEERSLVGFEENPGKKESDLVLSALIVGGLLTGGYFLLDRSKRRLAEMSPSSLVKTWLGSRPREQDHGEQTLKKPLSLAVGELEPHGTPPKPTLRTYATDSEDDEREEENQEQEREPRERMRRWR